MNVSRTLVESTTLHLLKDSWLLTGTRPCCENSSGGKMKGRWYEIQSEMKLGVGNM